MIVRRFLRFKLHLIDQLDTILSLIRTLSSESKNSISHISYVVLHAAIVRILEDLKYKVARGFGCRMNLLIKIPLNLLSQTFFTLDNVQIDHFSVSFQR